MHYVKGGVQSTRFLVYMGLTLLEHHFLASYHECTFKVYFIILINKINHKSSNIMLWKIDFYQRGKQFKNILYLNLMWNAYMLNCIKHVDFTCKKPWFSKLLNFRFQNQFWELQFWKIIKLLSLYMHLKRKMKLKLSKCSWQNIKVTSHYHKNLKAWRSQVSMD